MHRPTRNGATILWTSANLPSSLNANGFNASFAYAPDRSRWRQVASYSGGSETTTYVGGLMEILTTSTRTHWKHRIFTPSGEVQVIRRNDGSSDVYYLTTDHLGSTDTVMDAAATILARESFGAWGARRSSNWQGSPSPGEWQSIPNTTRRAYTAHDELDNILLVHMNGRVYDPAIGRFLAADPYVSGIDASQSWNRYAYVSNNPLAYVDPSGYFDSYYNVDAVDPGWQGFDFSFMNQGFEGWDSSHGQSYYASPPMQLGGGGLVGGGAGNERVGELGPRTRPGTYRPRSGGGGGKSAKPQKDPNVPKDPCESAGNAPSPQEYAAQGRRLNERQAYLNSVDDGTGVAATAGLLMNLAGLWSFHRGGALDAQAYGSSPAYANYAFGVYMAANGWSLDGALSGANMYASLFSNYPSNVPMSPTFPSTPASNVANITNGFMEQISESICKVRR